MRKSLLAVVLVLVACVASAQETYSISANANQVSRLTKYETVQNAKTCLSFALSIGCTQAQACTAAGAAGGASCTAAQARAANARIFPATQAGREEFLIFVIILGFGIPEFDRQAFTFDQGQFCPLFKAATQTARDNACTAIGASAGCEPCSP